jgi:predicted O-methyltransferase YrrM
MRKTIRRWLGADAFPRLQNSVIELNNVQELKKVFRWSRDPILDRPDIHDFDYVEDINERRVRDAETLATVIQNAVPQRVLEIGTSTGLGTVLMAVNAPQAQIFTVNVPPEEIEAGKGGELTTLALARDRIGEEYRKRGLANVQQIYANTATWEPDIGTIDVCFIDGCHDTEFVINDTRKVLKHMRTGSFLLWHDFHPGLAAKFDWINSVCAGIEKLYETRLLSGRLFHLRDSWTGVYRVG